MKKYAQKKVKRSSKSGAKKASTGQKSVRRSRKRPAQASQKKYTAGAKLKKGQAVVLKKGKAVPAQPALLPCAHCGAPAKYVEVRGLVEHHIKARCTNTYDCLMRTCSWSTYVDAAKAWNRRVR